MTCQTCGNPHQANFCPNCGEKRYDPHSLSLKHIAEETLEGFTHADHNIARTLKSVLLRPGKLTAEYVAGRRIRYMKPLALFLVVNLVFFLVSTFNVFNQPLYNFTHYDNFTRFGTREAVNRVLAASHESLSAYEKQFNIAMTANSKGYLIVLIPLFALVLTVILILSRRTFVEHLIFSAHFVTYMMLLFLLEQFVIVIPATALFGQQWMTVHGDALLSLSSLLIASVYLSIAIHRFYRTGIVWSIIVALLSSMLFGVVIIAYRLLLFYKIIYTGH